MDLLEIWAQSAPRDQKEILGPVGFLENRASDLTGWMASRVQTGFQGNSAKSDQLEPAEREVKWVLLVLLGRGVLRACIKARTCVPTPAPPDSTVTLVSPA